MSHYPSSAELAAFRRSIRPDWYEQDYSSQDLIGKAWPLAPLDYPANETAKRHGIVNGGIGRDSIARFARWSRKASFMRSRAYDRALSATGCEDCILMGNMTERHHDYPTYAAVPESAGFDMPESWIDPWTDPNAEPVTEMPIVDTYFLAYPY